MVQQNTTIAIILVILFVAIFLLLYGLLSQRLLRSPPTNTIRTPPRSRHTPSVHSTDVADPGQQIRLRDDVIHGPVRQRPEPAHLRR